MTPIDPLTLAEAGVILGCSRSTVRRHVLAGRLPAAPRYKQRTLPRTDVEALALQVYRWRLHLRDVDSYWITGKRAAAVLGVNEARLRVLAAKGFLPYETHVDGTRMYRREQIEIVAQGRQARWH